MLTDAWTILRVAAYVKRADVSLLKRHMPKKNIRRERMSFMVGLMGIEPTAFPTPRERAADAPQPDVDGGRR